MTAATVRIDIVLPKDRHQTGELLVTVDGHRLPPMRCLGRAANEKAAEAHNPSHDPTRRNGDTPVGSYIARFGVTPRPSQGQRGFGTHWIPLDPIGGQAQKAEDNGRAGLAIHGGRGDDRFVPTAGCVRVHDKDFAIMRTAIGAAKDFPVEISEVP